MVTEKVPETMINSTYNIYVIICFWRKSTFKLSFTQCFSMDRGKKFQVNYKVELNETIFYINMCLVIKYNHFEVVLVISKV
jgi:hypothetical protein